MQISEHQFEIYLKEAPPVIWVWIYGELKNEKAKLACHNFLFDETKHLRDLTPSRMRVEFNELISKFPEMETVAKRAATDFYIRNSWRKWLPWNWKK
jgi:hypothetical protein